MRLTAETAEEIARARDRMRVDHARSKRRPLVLFFLLAGPGILTMLGENDGPSMISYAATGANYGTSFFVPFVIGTFLMAYVIQEAAMRIGVATGKGHAQLIAERFGGAWAALALLDLLAGNALTLVAEFVAVCSGAAFLGIPKATAVVVSALLVFAAFATRRYFTWERLALVLALGNLVFVPIALRLQPHPGALLHAAFWRPPDRLDAAFLTLVLANVGATVTPWMIFFQQSAVVDKGLRSPDLRHARFDTAIGAALAALAAIAMLAIGAVLHAHGIGTAALRGGADFARVLRPTSETRPPRYLRSE